MRILIPSLWLKGLKHENITKHRIDVIRSWLVSGIKKSVVIPDSAYVQKTIRASYMRRYRLNRFVAEF